MEEGKSGWSYCRYRRGIALYGRHLSYLHPPTIDEISKPIHLSDPKALEAMYKLPVAVVSPPALRPLSPSGGLAFVVEALLS
jgi:hypothetical protein